MHYRFSTAEGEVDFLAEIQISGDTMIFQDVCIYATTDPPGIKRATISRSLLRQLRLLLQSGLDLGFAEVRVQGVRVKGSTSAKIGKVVDIRRRRMK